jgi:hypothetical protein
MKTVSRVIVTLGLAFTAGCGKPTIDTSSDEAIRASSQKVRESLPDSKRAEFDKALQILAFSQIDMRDLFAEGAVGAGALDGKIRGSLDGKTAEEVMAEAAIISAERQARERDQALEEIKELEAKRHAAEHAQRELRKFEVLRSRFYMKEQEFMGEQPIIELSVRNGTGSPVSRAYFEGIIASPDRSVPWHQDTFNHSIPGGIEPGEDATWSLAPNMFSGWGNVDAPADAVFTVTVEGLDGPGGETLYSVRDFGEREMERLAELRSRYGAE